ncbi:MAG: SDR family oxidoreductase [Promethearchaeota archaeon]|nr:MAG: SDR family oxidoreductase [Candidatus Lokiarchaeota archaeon]
MFDLKDKTIIVTGGAGLLGSAFSKACAEYGANIISVDINEEKANELMEQIKKETEGNNIIFQKCDITNKNNVQKLIDAVLNKFGEIDALVNNAYPRNKNYGKKYEDVTYEDFCENINLHVGGYFLITQQVSKIMMRQNYGNIINISSIYGFAAPRFEIYEGTEMTTPVEYAAIKGAIINLTKYLASYLGKYNIRVNCISPGGIFNNQPESFVKKYSQKVLLGKRMANVDDLIEALLFLLSDGSKYITGQNIVVDGGWSL